MNEKEMEHLFEGYRDSLGTCGRTPVISPKRRPRLRLGWAFAAGTALVFTGTIALWPADAAATAVRRMEKAILNARTMEMTFEMKRPSGSWRVFDREYARDGMWRYESRQGTPLEASYIVLSDGRTIEDYRELDHATIAPGDLSQSLGDQSALEFAKSSIDAGQEGVERTVRVQAHAPVGGVPTYVLTLERAEDDYHGEIVVDARNDLPISSEFSVRYRKEEGIVRCRQTYRFNAPLPDALFEPNKAKPLIDVSRAVADLEKRWEKPLARVGDVAVRDACVTEDGTVWIAATAPDAFRPTSEPGEWKPSRLPSEIVGAKPYVRLRDLSPAAIIEGYRLIRLFGDDIVVLGFVPLDPGTRPTGRITLRVAERSPAPFAWQTPAASREEAVEDVSLSVRRVPGDRPEYFTALLLDHFGFQLPPIVSGARAEGLSKAGRRPEAAKAHEEYGIAWAKLSPRRGAAELETAAKLYDDLGKAADAARARAGAATLLANADR